MKHDNLNGKRLLLLGGGLWKEAVRNFAREQEIKLIATGNSSKSGIFEISDEHYLVDSTDAEAMKTLIKEKNIDGVYMGGSEPVISAASKYLNEIDMPCYCTKEQWEHLQHKVNFKKLCSEHGLPVVPRYEIDDLDPKLPANVFPVITKPADGSGSRGFSVCTDNEELAAGYAKAKESSDSGEVIVEKFVKNKGVVVFLTFSNGVMHFSGLEDKYPVKYEKEGSYVAGLLVFESRFTKEFRDKFENRMQKMFSSIGIKEGSVWIEVFHDGDEYYFNEVGYRYGGTVSVYPVDYFYGINQVASDIYYALTGKSKILGHTSLIAENVPRKAHYAVYPIHLKAGKICSVEGVDFLKKEPDVIEVILAKTVGTVVEQTGSFAQNFALVHFVFDTIEELHGMLDKIHDTLLVKDEIGNNMVHRMLDTQTEIVI